MIPGNVDPRRAEKVQRYKPPQANGNAPVEDLTPDYMNILGPDSATANADGIEKSTSAGADHHQQQLHEDAPGAGSTTTTTTTVVTAAGVAAPDVVQTSNGGSNVIPTSPQYGVAIITNHQAVHGSNTLSVANSSTDLSNETITPSTDSVVETTAKSSLATAPAPVDDAKDMHSTPSRNDRFKVVKIASLEPFRRGRWKCMDYVDENPPPTTQQASKQTQSATNIQQMSNVQYMQTQSLPQQHFQQMLVQGAFSGTPQGFYQGMPNTMIPQSQYFYPAQTTLQQVPVQTNNLPPGFMNNQQYFPPNVAPHSAAGYSYSNVYVQPNLMQTQSSAFVPTSQTVPTAQLPSNFQQSQTYAGQPSQTPQPMVNGHAFPPPNEQQQQGGQQQQPQSQPTVTSLPTQIAKNVVLQPAIISANPLVNQSVSQPQQQYNPSYNPTSIPNPTPQGAQGTPVAIASAIITPVPVVNQLPTQIPAAVVNNQPTSAAGATVTMPPASSQPINFPHIPTQSAYELNIAPTNAVYTNPQFVAPDVVNSNEGQGDGTKGVNVNDVASNSENPENASGEDPAKANPVVNAIDNKIEQAMDLVKSHLMYTVREEVEVLKEKIVELMERIQQLESENAYLKQQVSKEMSANGAKSASSSGTPDAGGAPTPQQQPPPQSQNTQPTAGQSQ